MPARSPRKLVVIGTGLIGGSFALALKEAGAAATVVGVGRSRGNLELARRRAIVDRAHTLDDDWTAELADADLVLLATPVGEMPALFVAMAPRLGAATLVTDAGSTKEDVIDAARLGLGAAFARFVPAHPIAGSEQSGAGAASAALFGGRMVVLTPTPETDAAAIDEVRRCWIRCGATVSMLGAGRHDAILSVVSHLPHVLAFALIAELSARGDADEYFRLAGTGLRDFTRLAASHPDMWRDVCLANAARLRADLAAYSKELDRIDAMLARGDGAALGRLFAQARAARGAWLADGAGGHGVD